MVTSRFSQLLFGQHFKDKVWQTWTNQSVTEPLPCARDFTYTGISAVTHSNTSQESLSSAKLSIKTGFTGKIEPKQTFQISCNSEEPKRSLLPEVT